MTSHLSPTRLRAALALAVAFALAGWSGRADASPVQDALGSVGGGAGFQGVVTGPGAASAYFNPALLMYADDDALFAFAVMSEQVGVTLDARRGGDVPLSVGGRDIIGPDGAPIPNDSVPTPWLADGCDPGTTAGTCPAPGFRARPRQAAGSSGKTRTYLALGIVKSLVRDRFTFGAYVLVPLSSFTTAQSFYADEREALFSNSLHPELYGDRLTAISVTTGAAFKLMPDLSIGASVNIGLANVASSSTYIRDSTNYDTLLLNTSVSTHVNVAPTLGLVYAPARWLRFGGALHTTESFEIDTTIDATLPSGTESGTTRHDVYDWTPWTVDVGVETDVVHRGSYTMSLTGSVKYAFWSSYVDRHGQSPATYGADLAWNDTLSVVAGVRHHYKQARGFIDLAYVPSPVPDQVGRSNYVDNDRVGAAIGADIEIAVGSTRLRPGLQMFGSRLVRRHVTKDDARLVDELPDGSVTGSTHDPVPGAAGLQTNNPGWPGFASEGWLWGGAFTLAVPL